MLGAHRVTSLIAKGWVSLEYLLFCQEDYTIAQKTSQELEETALWQQCCQEGQCSRQARGAIKVGYSRTAREGAGQRINGRMGWRGTEHEDYRHSLDPTTAFPSPLLDFLIDTDTIACFLSGSLYSRFLSCSLTA